MLFSRDDLKRLIVPLMLEQALAVAIGMMDTVMVASCGEAAVSGVSLVDSINILLIQVFSAMATGGSVLVSQYLGKKDREGAGQSAEQLYYVVLIVSMALTALCLGLRTQLLSALFGSIDADVMRAAQDYMLVSAMSYPFLAVYNASASLLRAEGDTPATLRISIAMNVINVVGNAITIYGLGMGVLGAGLATLVSRAIGAVAAQFPLRKPGCAIPYPDFAHPRWRGGLNRKILSVGIPNGLENGMFQFGKLILVRMISTMGTASIDANAVGNTLGTIHCLPGGAMNLAMLTVVGRCVGAHDYQQARHYTRKLMRITYLTQGILNIVLLLLNPVICKPFNLSAEAERLARIIAVIHGVGALVDWPLSFVLPNSLRAAGDARFTMAVSSFSMVVFRVGGAYLFSLTLGMGVLGVWVAMQVDWIFRITCFLIRYHSHRWETKALV